MATTKERVNERKLSRNKKILSRYEDLKAIMTCRETYPILMDEFNLSESTILNILFVKSYSNSPLA
ncbi:hypothetical protein Q763_01540 [Flavobacterium beibuense F44-8]|uniref:Transposase n=1 Tax=Flavobacterium beibuense F44-8 TaxID=1406840 RepID=A0A0A2LVQ8_9FLAO|nr:hypothetical protein [Flavobacterium beibuense]KGO84452.1 hypothetical protein Q763_01540 [Flavobacterium beibuense F44-8]